MRWPKAKAEGFAYRGGADFVLRHGEAFGPRKLPDEYEHGRAGACYWNAILLARRDGLAYVEGFALDPDLRHVFAHAWNAEPDGGLVDVTWTGAAAVVQRGEQTTIYVGRPGAAYLGVRFHSGRADDAAWYGDAHILDDAKRGWPVFQEPWAGEDYEREWTPSPPMAELDRRGLLEARR